MMKIKKYAACLTASLLICAVSTACSSAAPANSPAETAAVTEEIVQEAPATSPVAANGDINASAAETDVPQEVTVAPDVEFEPANTAQPGQAYLAIVDGQWWVQYWGSAEKDGYMLSYNAGIADIKGDGVYTVSVTADTNGFRYDTTGSADGEYIPEGLSFMSIMIPDGETLYPGAVIQIESIKVDGNELELKAKNYTSSDDGKETRSNIYNSYVTSPSDDARTPEGALYDEDGDALSICKEYSPQLVDPADFAQWKTVEVMFTITGTDGSNAQTEAENEQSGEEDE